MFNRRGFVGAMATASLAGILGKKGQAKKASAMAPDLHELDKAAATPVLKLDKLKAPVIIGKDARDLENLLWGLYRWKDNYKLYGLALWSPQAWVEFAILDMLGRIAGQPIGVLLGAILRQDVEATRRLLNSPNQCRSVLKRTRQIIGR